MLNYVVVTPHYTIYRHASTRQVDARSRPPRTLLPAHVPEAVVVWSSVEDRTLQLSELSFDLLQPRRDHRLARLHVRS